MKLREQQLKVKQAAQKVNEANQFAQEQQQYVTLTNLYPNKKFAKMLRYHQSLPKQQKPTQLLRVFDQARADDRTQIAWVVPSDKRSKKYFG